MARTYEFAVLTATPDPLRGERVNIGVVVFRGSELDVRLAELNKIRAFTGYDWTDYASAAEEKLRSIFESANNPRAFAGHFATLESVFSLSDLAWFIAGDEPSYEARVASILDSVVRRPKPAPLPKTSRINTEIAETFKRAQVLATPSETIDDHKVVRDFVVAEKESLKADFALRNGVLHVTATLDLRKPKVDISQAALKALILDRAKYTFSEEVRRTGVYAAEVGNSAIRSHVEILRDYADVVYNWMNNKDREIFTKTIHNAATATHLPLFRVQ